MLTLKYLITIGTILLISDYTISDNKETKRLQIGIKKRSTNCEDKSKKGDLLHVHYKVYIHPKPPYETLAFWFLRDFSRMEHNLIAVTLGRYRLPLQLDRAK